MSCYVLGTVLSALCSLMQIILFEGMRENEGGTVTGSQTAPNPCGHVPRWPSHSTAPTISSSPPEASFVAVPCSGVCCQELPEVPDDACILAPEAHGGLYWGGTSSPPAGPVPFPIAVATTWHSESLSSFGDSFCILQDSGVGPRGQMNAGSWGVLKPHVYIQSPI